MSPQPEGGQRLGMSADPLRPAGSPAATALINRLRSWRPTLEVQSLEPLGQGDFCHAFLLNGHEVVRVPRHPEAAEALAREACLLRHIGPLLPLPVPALRRVPGPSPGGPLAVHERVPGTELSRALWLRSPKPERARLAREVGAFLRVLHGLNVDVGRRCGLPEVDHRADVARLRLRLGGPPGSFLQDALRTSLERGLGGFEAGLGSSPAPVSLLHADLGPGHVFCDPERWELTGVIDWGDARIGDPARDFIFVYEDWGPGFLEAALEAYGAGAGKDGFARRVLLHYLVDQLHWTLGAAEVGRAADVEHGVRALGQAVIDLDRFGEDLDRDGRVG